MKRAIIFVGLKIVEAVVLIFPPYWLGSFLNGKRDAPYIIDWMSGLLAIVLSVAAVLGLMLLCYGIIKVNLKLSKKLAKFLKTK